MQSKPLTKSRFKTGSECPTKLYYTARKEYGNKNDTDQFLKALADGGFQVGELAKLYYPGGTQIDSLDYAEAVKQTDELMKKDSVVIYEAAFAFENLFVRVDILEKKGNKLNLIEVKAKSFNPQDEPFEDLFDKRKLKKGEYVLKDEWQKYLIDLAFQTHVARSAKPNCSVVPHLMLADKSTRASVDGLNQLFLIGQDKSGRSKVEVSSKALEMNLGTKILTSVSLEKQIDLIIQKGKFEFGPTFLDLVRNLSHWQATGEQAPATVSSTCKKCEFRIDKANFNKDTMSGFEQCWSQARKLKSEDFSRQFIFDVWDFRRADAVLDEGIIFAKDLKEDDIGLKEREDDLLGWSRTQRQLIQIQAAGSTQPKISFDHDGMKSELSSFPAPYHFIDFETTMAAIPFHKGRKPYEQVAFQFSHHVIHKDGRIEHKTEYLNTDRGTFPNFDFVRNLKKALSADSGTVFRFADHENTVLNQIHAQLGDSSEKDKDELMSWIESLTTPPDWKRGEWKPTRHFVDMLDLVVRFVYLPEAKGSNSIKKVLPAVLNQSSSKFREKFKEWIRVQPDGRVGDPYKLLPNLFKDIDPDQVAKVERWLMDRDELNDGGAAMIAWAKMQFSEMSDVEREMIRSGLLRYCKLDTLAMVMIWEWWQEELFNKQRRAG